jgi:hypothetical protein
MGFVAMITSAAGLLSLYMWEGDPDKSTTIIRVVAGVLAVLILVVLIQRRRTRVK